MKGDNQKENPRVYVAPEMICVVLQVESRLLTTSGDINDMPWGD